MIGRFLLAAMMVFVANAALARSFEGLSGRELADAVRAEFAPKNVPSGIPGINSRPSDWPKDWMPPVWFGSDETITLLVPDTWTKNAPIYDLYNLVCADWALDSLRIEQRSTPTAIPAELVDVKYKGRGWLFGTADLDGVKTSAWEPADNRKGDFARRMMYVGLMYPQIQWSNTATAILSDGDWPLLTTFGRNLLIEWSKKDPLDTRELSESAEIARIQGNENPFIAIPDLAEYLWGEDSGQGYIPEDKQEMVPLKATYIRSTDRSVYLYTPYVGADAEWKIDGMMVEGSEIPLEELSDGIHTLSYTLPGGGRGKIKIEIKP